MNPRPKPPKSPKPPSRPPANRYLRAWFALTVEEQRALAVILALFLLGVATRFWHLCLRA